MTRNERRRSDEGAGDGRATKPPQSAPAEGDDDFDGCCANCDGLLDPLELASLYCSERCRSFAKDVRWFRRRKAEGRLRESDIRTALRTRIAHLVVGGYAAGERRLSADVRAEVLADNGGRCCICNAAAASEVDHIDGPSSERSNLQGVCGPCHHVRTVAHFKPLATEHQAVFDEFRRCAEAPQPLRLCHDEKRWPSLWPALMADARLWCEVGGEVPGYFDDDTIEDFEEAWYFRKVMLRD
jgi:5-methylcytosine-specific restriction endonuclease McrA